MRPAESVQAFLRAPEGRYVVGPSWSYFCRDRGLWGLVLWGEYDGALLERVVRMVLAELACTIDAHAVLVDARDVQGITADCFPLMVETFRGEADRLRARVSRLAFLRPTTFFGTVLEGLYHLVPLSFPVRVTVDLAQGLQWLGRHDPTIGAFLDELRASASGTPPLLREVRARLEARPGDFDVGTLASAIGTSKRTLQRQLREAGTTFASEMRAAQVRVAKRLLSTTDAKVARIARDIGFATPGHFATMFRRETGETPAGWRSRCGPSGARG